LDQVQALLGVAPIPLYQLRHTPGPNLDKRVSAATSSKKIRSVPRHHGRWLVKKWSQHPTVEMQKIFS
jgi:hypothetical protein